LKQAESFDSISYATDEKIRQFIPASRELSTTDWIDETYDPNIVIGAVQSIEEAIAHINENGSHLSDVIISESEENQNEFTRKVDSAIVYINASTAFTDGAEFGIGSDVGISTDKLGARGPISMSDLTTTKYLVKGTGQIRSK
jgi:glutamate-5-semialdehyde dehydrogenase